MFPQSSRVGAGQVAPPGGTPRVTSTLWEDEESLCIQVETEGICVARCEDNHMINGKELLKVAGIPQDRRDNILKAEKTRHVIKTDPPHLKGVWILYERALELAVSEGVVDKLYPLFVHDIGDFFISSGVRTYSKGNDRAAHSRTQSKSEPLSTSLQPEIWRPS